MGMKELVALLDKRHEQFILERSDFLESARDTTQDFSLGEIAEMNDEFVIAVSCYESWKSRAIAVVLNTEEAWAAVPAGHAYQEAQTYFWETPAWLTGPGVGISTRSEDRLERGGTLIISGDALEEARAVYRTTTLKESCDGN